jgi:phosphohistidine phosphatase
MAVAQCQLATGTFIMKYLTIVRHGKAALADTLQQDFDRPLVDKGYKQIKQIAPAILSNKIPPDRVISSPALRTHESARSLIEALDFNGEILLEKRIYEATPTALLEILRDQPTTVQHVILVGHNPGLSMLISGLCSGDDARLNLHLPTGGVAQIQLEVARWRQVRWGSGILRFLISPRSIKKSS